MANDPNTGRLIPSPIADPERARAAADAIRAEASINNAQGGGYGPVGGKTQERGNAGGVSIKGKIKPVVARRGK